MEILKYSRRTCKLMQIFISWLSGSRYTCRGRVSAVFVAQAAQWSGSRVESVQVFSSVERKEKTSPEFQRAAMARSLHHPLRPWWRTEPDLHSSDPTHPGRPPPSPFTETHTHIHIHTQCGCVPGQWGRCYLLWREVTSAALIRRFSFSTRQLQKLNLGIKHRT